MNASAASRTHQQHLELARAQVIELLSRQAVERGLVARAVETGGKQDVLASLIARQQQAALEQRLAQFHPADIAFVLESLPLDQRQQAWGLVRAERRGAVLLETAGTVRDSLVCQMAPEEIALVVKAMDAEDSAALVASLPHELREQVLTRMDREGQEQVSSVLSFPDDTAGALMTRDALTVRDDASLEAVLRLLRRRERLPPHSGRCGGGTQTGHATGRPASGRVERRGRSVCAGAPERAQPLAVAGH